MQENNKQLASHLKEKHQQVLSLKESNKLLKQVNMGIGHILIVSPMKYVPLIMLNEKQVNMDTGLEEKATLKTELEEVREALGRRDTEVC